MLNLCKCNPGEINLECPIHGPQAQAVVHQMIRTGGDVDNRTEQAMNEDIKRTVKSITRMGDIKDRFTVAIPFEGEEGQVWSVWIKRGKDSICCTPSPLKEQKHAEAFREYLAVLLDKIVSDLK